MAVVRARSSPPYGAFVGFFLFGVATIAAVGCYFMYAKSAEDISSARNDASSNRLQLTQPAMRLRRRRPRLGFEQFAIITNVRRIDSVGFVAAQLGTHEVPNLGGIDNADDMTSLVQRAGDAEAIAPGRFQTSVNPSAPLGD